MAVRRDLKWIYRALLKENGKVVKASELVGYYEDYERMRQRIIKSEVVPKSLKSQVSPLKVPNYIKWISQYLLRKEDEVF